VNTLYVIDGPLKGNSFTLNIGTISIARSPDNDICVSDIGASRRHAKLIKKNNNIFIEDVSSFQGVYIDEERIEKGQEVELKKDNILMIGGTVFSFQKEPARAKVAEAYVEAL
jgi:pSer/pThr/pTyr-binding forkhead associated (FHA) protein